MQILPRILVFLAFAVAIGSCSIFSFQTISKVASYARYLYPSNLTAGAAGNELWTGILKDCRGKMSFSCLQKNAYSYLDSTFERHDNVTTTVFGGVIMRRNGLNYDTCTRNCEEDVNENLVEDTGARSGGDRKESDKASDPNENLYEEKMSPLEEITSALRDKTVKFLATRDYEVQLPEFFFQSSKIRISPREIDEDGALVRIDFGERGLDGEGRLFFKKIKKWIQNRLLVALLALILIIKLIKVKFMFIVPFLFGVGTAKKIFLKILLFLVPAFAHVFKLCSSYYSSHTKLHHHHHQIAHHHHHVPVPVPIPSPVFFDHHAPPHHPPHHEEEFDGYDYAHPHIQLRKDMEELKEWGIDSFGGEPYDDRPPPPAYPSFHQGPPPAVKTPHPVTYQEKPPPNLGPALAYNGYVDEQKFHRRVSAQGSPFPQPVNPALKQTPISVSPAIKSNLAAVSPVYVPPSSVRVTQQVIPKSASPQPSNNQHDDTFYGPILDRLDEIFGQLRFTEEPCRERLICSMYKNPSLYSPHSNLVSNELSRDPQELKRGSTMSSQRFHSYVSAARFGQDGGDCTRAYQCNTNTE